MRVVVDTNVIAYYLLGTEPYIEEVREFWSTVTEPMAPSSWEAEIANVLWMATRTKVTSQEAALSKLEYALGLGVQSIPVSALWKGALTRSIQKTIAVYDTLFVELAERESVPLATFDGLVLKAFPTLARRPRDILQSRKQK